MELDLETGDEIEADVGEPGQDAAIEIAGRERHRLAVGEVQIAQHQPVFGAQGRNLNVVGSATISASAAPSISFMPKPPPGVKAGNTVRCAVSLASRVVVTPTPLFIEESSAAAVTDLPRITPCWSAKDRRMTSRPSASTRR